MVMRVETNLGREQVGNRWKVEAAMLLPPPPRFYFHQKKKTHEQQQPEGGCGAATAVFPSPNSLLWVGDKAWKQQQWELRRRHVSCFG